MEDGLTNTLGALARSDVTLMRMNALLLSTMVHRGLLTNAQARQMIEDVLENASDGALLAPALRELIDEFRG